jgi:3-hydroxyisobutyrate dehydrogenase-like beta-hydroxyacid dehydrogenase
MSQTIGFIGLGNMGRPMAGNLLKAGFQIRVYNRTREKALELEKGGAVVVDRPEEIAKPGGIAVSMLANDQALESAGGDLLADKLGRGGLHISMSTVLPATSQRLAGQYARHGAAFVAAPVFGRPEAAEARKLWICASGPAAEKQRAKPVFDAIGQSVFDFGEAVGAANVVKLAGNFMLTAAIEAMAEASALAEKNGIPREKLLGMLTQTLFNCPIYSGYGKRLIDADFDKVGFALPLALKDMTLAHQTAAASHTPMPILSLLVDRFISALAKGRDKLDASGLALGVADDAGLQWSPEQKA